MAKVRLNPVLEKIRGKVGDLVFKRYRDEVVISRTPQSGERQPTPAQASQQERFKLAVLYGNTVLADPEKRAIYEAAAERKGVPVFALTVGDFLNAPAVDEIDVSGYTGKAGETIRVRASDDFAVTGVEVSITDSNGSVLEKGTATLVPGSGEWIYQTTTEIAPQQQVSIEVTATDRPGHKTSRTAAAA